MPLFGNKFGCICSNYLIYVRSDFTAKLNELGKLRDDPQLFIETISFFWENYQRFVFIFRLITEKATIFFKTFNKTQDKVKATKSIVEVQPVAVIGVN